MYQEKADFYNTIRKLIAVGVRVGRFAKKNEYEKFMRT